MLIDGVDVRELDPVVLRRGIGYVIQAVGLFFALHGRQNVGVVAAAARLGARHRARDDELLALVRLEPTTYRDRYPRQLSGGEQQRVGVARALAAQPRVLLMDEPFGAVDAIVRASLQDEIRRIHRELGTTIVFVTHDVDEALRLADRVVVIAGGAIAQAAAPQDVLAAPANDFVRSLVGIDPETRRLALERPLERSDDVLRHPAMRRAALRRAPGAGRLSLPRSRSPSPCPWGSSSRAGRVPARSTLAGTLAVIYTIPSLALLAILVAVLGLGADRDRRSSRTRR